LVPWGFVCGFPTTNGDCYGGGHYIDSSAATMTLQGRAIKQAAIDFGDGKTLPFTPCKKGYIPRNNGQRMVACPLHNQKRQKRLAKEGGKVRKGEANPEELFWSKETPKEENLAEKKNGKCESMSQGQNN